MAVGALAVRRRDWAAVHDLALQAPRGEHHPNGRVEGYYGNWLRHALTHAARANPLDENHQGRKVQVSLLGQTAGHRLHHRGHPHRLLRDLRRRHCLDADA
jgi:hypothetical protein